MSEIEYSSYSKEEIESKESDVIGIESEEIEAINEVSVFDEKGQAKQEDSWSNTYFDYIL